MPEILITKARPTDNGQAFEFFVLKADYFAFLTIRSLIRAFLPVRLRR